MSKKPAKKRIPAPAARPAGNAAPAQEQPEARPGGRALWALATVLIVAGFIMLRLVDPAGSNGWATAAPLSLLGGYLLIIPAIINTYRD